MSDHQVPANPKRFEVSRRILVIDFVMGWVVKLGGFTVIVAVFGILFFVAKEVLPLFRKARLEASGELAIATSPAIIGVDEWGEMPFVYNGGNEIRFRSVDDGSVSAITLPGLEEARVTAYSYDPYGRRLSVASDRGGIHSFRIVYEREFPSTGAMSVNPGIRPEPWITLQQQQGEIRRFDYAGSNTERVMAASFGGRSLVVAKMRKKRSLIGEGGMELLWEKDLTESMDSDIERILVSSNANTILVVGADGGVRYFLAEDNGVSLRQVFRPFGRKPPERVDFLFGGESAVCTGTDGRQQQWSLFRTSEDLERTFGLVREFEPLAGQATFFSTNQRNRTFATGSGKEVSLRYSTTGAERWKGSFDFEVETGLLDSKGQHLFLLGADGTLRRFAMDDPHPEASWITFFGKVWYEGGSEPVYQWQSSGGGEGFEPKLSLVPLIFGSVKGAVYAMLFSVPIALMAAVYSAAFLPGRMKKVVKPVMEIMASLPSVILGFLAGFWLAPMLENRVPSMLLLLLFLPLSALAFGFLWGRLPVRLRNSFPRGTELWVLLPVLGTAAVVAWFSGPVLEAIFFRYHDPASGEMIASFRMWWPQATGIPFEQQNSMIFGFVMGFAVIPVIFTISEDSLTNVPRNLTASAAALGANRWQVVRTVLIPIASPGIFSSLIIGFGRAVGETMIMVMATGNTPITEWNPFSGFRSLSANIAIELPEAAGDSTHYRALFLGAVLLFVLTFVMNSIAELLRQRLRERNQLI